MSFESDIRRFNMKVRDAAEDEFRARCLALANGAIRNTPVLSGRLRANWQATIDSPALGDLESQGPRLGLWAAQNNVALTAASLRIDQAFYLTNNLPYAVPVEEGNDKMPPRRMLARAIQAASRR
ncbi:MAG: hypothetical protein AAGI72_15520 [Pseudomonadota bacterium]